MKKLNTVTEYLNFAAWTVDDFFIRLKALATKNLSLEEKDYFIFDRE